MVVFLVDYKNKLIYFECIIIEKEECNQHEEYTTISYVVERIWGAVEWQEAHNHVRSIGSVPTQWQESICRRSKNIGSVSI